MSRDAMVRHSDDGGHTWSNWRVISLGQAGQYDRRVRLWANGHFINRIFHVRVASPCKRDLLAVSVNVKATNR